MLNFRQHFKRSWRSISTVLWFLFFQLLFAAILPPFMGLNQVMSTVFASLLSSMATITIMVWRQHVNMNDLRCGVSKGQIGLLVLLMITVAVSLNIIEEWLDIPDMLQDVMIAIMRQPLGILAVAVIGPITEELVFRGGLMGGLISNGYSAKAAILTSALLFGIIHFNPVQVVFAAMAGLILGWAYYKTKSLTPSILMHIANNSFSVVTMYISEDPTAKLTDVIGYTAAIGLLAVGIICSVFLFKYLNKQLA